MFCFEKILPPWVSDKRCAKTGIHKVRFVSGNAGRSLLTTFSNKSIYKYIYTH